jgi:flagellar assembly protein FliH
MSDAAFTPFAVNTGDESAGFRAWSATGPVVLSDPAEAQDAFAQGFEQGQQVAQAAFALERDRLLLLVRSAEQLQPIDISPLARIINSTVERLVRDIAGNALVDADLLAKQIDDVLAMATAQTDRKILRLHPDDVVLLSNIEIAAEVRADPSIAVGSMCLDLDDGVIEHGRAPMLEALDAVLQRVDPAS